MVGLRTRESAARVGDDVDPALGNEGLLSCLLGLIHPVSSDR